MHKFALSLSGGGLSSLAYASFNDTLLENDLIPSYYAGLSGGAIVAVLLASKYNYEQVLEFFNEINTLSVLNTHLSNIEIVDHHKLTDHIRKLLPYKSFEDLPTQTAIFTSDVTHQQPIMITSGDIASAVVASCSVFPLLQAYKRRGLLLADGGFTTYYGAKSLRELGASKVIGIDVTGLTERGVKGILSFLYKQINSTVTSNAHYELIESPVDVDIRINYPSPTIFNLKTKAPHLYALGKKIGMQNIHKIKSTVSVHEKES